MISTFFYNCKNAKLDFISSELRPTSYKLKNGKFLCILAAITLRNKLKNGELSRDNLVRRRLVAQQVGNFLKNSKLSHGKLSRGELPLYPIDRAHKKAHTGLA
jgi:retron-type reverse transcriptase